MDHGVEACSAHRNPVELRLLVRKFQDEKVDVVIMCAGKLAALFGECDALSRNNFGNDHTCFIAVPLKGDTEEASQAAHLSAVQVPNSQFVFQEAFFRNPEVAFEYAISGDLPTIRIEKQPPAESFSLAGAYHYGREHRKPPFPSRALYDEIIFAMEGHGLIHYATGKTRETFLNPEHPDLLYILATDRISIFDIVLNALIPNKGAVLTAMTIYWLKRVFSHIPNHLVAYGSGIQKWLPDTICYRRDAYPFLIYLAQHLIVVRKTDVLPVEAIVRGNLTGTGYKDYKKTGKVCGIELPSGLVDGSELPVSIFTASTKAPYGQHDENIPYERVLELIGPEAANYIQHTSIHLFSTARTLLRSKGIVLADTKFEFGTRQGDGGNEILLIDEALTPDSSRFWPEEGLATAIDEGKTPPSFDKQPVRDAGVVANVKSNPTWIPPDDLIVQTTDNYRHMLSLATGMSLEAFWAGPMGMRE